MHLQRGAQNRLDGALDPAVFQGRVPTATWMGPSEAAMCKSLTREMILLTLTANQSYQNCLGTSSMCRSTSEFMGTRSAPYYNCPSVVGVRCEGALARAPS